ncbi:phage tail-collar fiber domain-containing protein [Pseudomonas kurunegalensis]|uniref:phage tail-collar fiber domain-containing protein n=1 Tax=Pseudomonas kurunegalensis TaxID=485880 RepID=UPI0025709881|nr:phage tail protein [Pseudomonas kurunegalensis]WJD63105.1 phage tail protein [Pseudomonas kurunegalensis]
MGASITLAGQSLIAQKQANKQVLNVARFVFANVPGLNPSAPVDRAAGKPPAAQLVYTTAVQRTGYVNPNQVIYSVVADSSVGDWDFNWIGLETEENILLAVAYVPLQQKRKNIPPLQIGNNLTRNFLVEYDGAQEITGITVDASTWQHDFTVRLAGVDSRERLSNRDVYGRTCFWDAGLQLERSGLGVYQMKAGIAYIEGVRVALGEPAVVQLPALPTKAWIDVALRRQGNDVVPQWVVSFGSAKADYQDSDGTLHYLVELASVDASGNITDQRQWQPITMALVDHFAAKVGDYPALRARATTKDDVGLGNLPNAKSDDPTSDSSDILATTKALRAAIAQLENNQVGEVSFFDLDSPPPGFMRPNGAAVSRTVYARLFAKIGTRHGAGDGVSTFNLPDVRGLFIRVLDDGRNLDPGRVLGSTQADEIRSHSHTASSAGAGGHTHSASTAEAGNHAHLVRSGVYTPDGVDTSGEITEPRNIVNFGEAGVHDKLTSESGSHTHPVTVLAVGDHTHQVTVNATGGSETRPQNIAFNAFIKY